MVKGVGPQRAELLAKRGIHTLEDLLGYLPFRYEDRIHFTNIRDLQPGGTYTVRARVMSGSAVPSSVRYRRRDAIYHLLVQDSTGSLPCKFFHGGYLEGRLKPGQLLVLHGKVEVDRLRPARIEMVNPQMELLRGEEMDSTEVGRIVPIYEAIGTFGSRAIRRAVYGALQQFDAQPSDPLPPELLQRLGYPSRREALLHTHFPPPDESLDALDAAVIAIENGCQAALMAPTEILAVQHFLSARRILSRVGYRVELLISGLNPSEKAAARERVRTGEAQLVIGTHALIEEDVQFNRLGFVCIDEQHRFGVLQRKRLMDKAAVHGYAPHVLVLTATPIPRTLSLTLYGDLDVSLLDELPPGRAPIVTRISSQQNLPGVWGFLGRVVAAGRQAYIVYPVIEETKLELKAAIKEFARLSKEVFPKLRLGLLHGRLSSDEKEEMMQGFRRNEIQVLVATTVIEVGMDVPNATVMVVEHAERFGLAQLHQLRGRIGRGEEKSYCILIAPTRMSDEARLRLETMVRTTNGFEIAETDLQLRGPGEFFGTRQHGDLGFDVANPVRDRELLELARREAFQVVEDTNRGPLLQQILGALPPHWQRRYHLARVG